MAREAFEMFVMDENTRLANVRVIDQGREKTLETFVAVAKVLCPDFTETHEWMLKTLIDNGWIDWDGNTRQWFRCGRFQIQVAI